MRLAVIPARGGSKRIPRKNVKLFHGKPMIAWSIEVAKKSGCFDQILVSTDDSEIAEIAISYGADAPFIRPAELSDDFTGTQPVISHAIEWKIKNGEKPSEVCCIYATAPFLSANDLVRGHLLLNQEDCDYSFSATSYAFPIQRSFRVTSSKRVEMFFPEYFESRSQDLEDAYHDAGQFYWGKVDAWAKDEPIFSLKASPVILPRHLVQDIDTPNDWLRAELMFKALHL